MRLTGKLDWKYGFVRKVLYLYSLFQYLVNAVTASFRKAIIWVDVTIPHEWPAHAPRTTSKFGTGTIPS